MRHSGLNHSLKPEASACEQVAFNPKVLLPLSHIGEQDEFRVQDASSFAAMNDELSYWELLVCSLPLTVSMIFDTGTLFALGQKRASSFAAFDEELSYWELLVHNFYCRQLGIVSVRWRGHFDAIMRHRLH